MRFLLCAVAVIVAIISGGARGTMDQPNSQKLIAQFPGASLKWIHAAEPEFERRKLDLDKYIVSVTDMEDSVMVSLTPPDSRPGWRGSSGSLTGFSVTINKVDLKIIRSNFIR